MPDAVPPPGAPGEDNAEARREDALVGRGPAAGALRGAIFGVTVLQYLVAGAREGASREGVALAGAAAVSGIVGGIIFGPLALLARRVREVPVALAVWVPACAAMGAVVLRLGSWLERWPAASEFGGTAMLVAAVGGAVVGTFAGIIYGLVKPRHTKV